MPRYYHLDTNCLHYGNLMHAAINLDREHNRDWENEEIQLAMTASALYEQTGFRDPETLRQVRGENYRLHGERLDDIHFYPPGGPTGQVALENRIQTALDALDDAIEQYAQPERFSRLSDNLQQQIRSFYRTLVKDARNHNPDMELHDELRMYPADDPDEAHQLQNELVRVAFRHSSQFRGLAIHESRDALYRHYVEPENFEALDEDVQEQVLRSYKSLLKNARRDKPSLTLSDEMIMYPPGDTDESHRAQNNLVRKAFSSSDQFVAMNRGRNPLTPPATPLALLSNMADDELAAIVRYDIGRHAGNQHVVVTDDVRDGVRLDRERLDRGEPGARFSATEQVGQSLYLQIVEALNSYAPKQWAGDRSFVMTSSEFADAVAQAAGHTQLAAMDEHWKPLPQSGQQARIQQANQACIDELGKMRKNLRQNAQDVPQERMHDFARYLAHIDQARGR